jgi:hypothetical protein
MKLESNTHLWYYCALILKIKKKSIVFQLFESKIYSRSSNACGRYGAASEFGFSFTNKLPWISSVIPFPCCLCV